MSEGAAKLVSQSSQKWKMGVIVLAAIIFFGLILVIGFSFFEPDQTPVNAPPETSSSFPIFIFGILFFVAIIIVVVYFFTRRKIAKQLGFDEAAELLVNHLNAKHPGRQYLFGSTTYAGIDFLDKYIIELKNQPNHNRTFIVLASKPLTIKGSFYSSWKEMWEELKNEEFLKQTYLEEVKKVRINEAIKQKGLVIEEGFKNAKQRKQKTRKQKTRKQKTRQQKTRKQRKKNRKNSR